MLNAFLVIVPVFALIFAGNLCRRYDFPGDHFWAPAERLTYFVFFPALLTVTLAEADFSRLDVLPMVLAVVTAILLMTLLSLVVRPYLRVDGPGFTSFYQGVVRMNTYVGLSVAFGLYGEMGLIAASVAVAAIVPLVNVTGILILARYGSARQPTIAGMVRQMLRNPLILACVAGAALNLTGLGLPPVLGDLLKILSRAALPLGLLAVGAALDLGAVRSAKHLLLASTASKLVLLPLLTFGFCLAFGVGGLALNIAVLFAALPTATSAYVLARLLGGDAPLMANLCTVQTLASMITIPTILMLLPGPAA
jgi:predicted permease